VYASRDGILYRLLVTERGYGNAVYLKHPDDTFTVYAHMQRFNNKFQVIADSIRLTDFSFEMDVIMDSLSIEVEQGDVIGYTGSTGIGPPHLHFEIRDSLQQPINALRTNLSVKDDIPPVFSSLIVEPLTKDSRIEKRPTSYYTRNKSTKGGFVDFGKIKVSGKAGLAINVYDQANDVYNAYAVYSLALVHKNDTLFYEELNGFSYDETSEMVLVRIAPFGSTRRGHQRLYEKDGSDIPFYITTKKGAEIEAQDSAQTFTIIASDYFGNTSKAQVTIVKDPLQSSATPTLNLDTPSWYWQENWASPDLTNTLDLTLTDLGYQWTETQQIVPLDSGSYTSFTRITPNQSQKIQTPDKRLRLRFSEQAFYDTLTVTTSYSFIDDEIHISLQPEMLPTKSDFGLEIFMGDFFKKNNAYRLFQKDKSDGSLDYVNSELIGRTIHAYPSDLGEFVIRPDNTPPTIAYFQIYQTDYGKWMASVQVKDEDTGIESSSAIFKINGIRGIAEYDYEEELLIYNLPDFSRDSSNTATIEIKDRAGNVASKTIEN
jgi:hypothetical protein